MNNLTEQLQIDNILNQTSGVTAAVYGYPAYDMADYDRADFVIHAFGLSPGTATGAVNIVQAAVYTATAATSTALTAISSATAVFGSTLTSVLGIVGAQRLTVTFNTASTGTTYSINGKQFTVQSTQSVSSYESLGGTAAITNATYASAFAAIINDATATFSSWFEAATEKPVGASVLSSNAAYVYPKTPGSRTLSATGHYGATANKGVLVSGDFVAHIGVPAEKMVGARYITIACHSSGLKVPFSVELIRSKGRYDPPGNAGMAVNVNLGSTS